MSVSISGVDIHRKLKQLSVVVAVVSTNLIFTEAIAQEISVPYGSSKEAFAVALKDMEPVRFVLQSTHGPQNINSLAWEVYAELVTDWSGGKIQGEVVYGSAIVQGNPAPAVADGRLSYGSIIAQYDPSNFPVASALVGLSFVNSGSPFAGTLQSYAVMMETANATPEAWEEQRSFGLEPGYVLGGAPPSGFFCREPLQSLADFAGIQSRTSGAIHSAQVNAIGATPVALPFSEMYEGLQRGIIDCALTAITTANQVGIIPLAPYHTVSSDVGFALTNINFAFDKVMWEELPLAARQLLYDLQKDFIRAALVTTFTTTKEGLLEFAVNNGEFLELGDDAKDRLRAYNVELLEQARSNAAFGDGGDVVDRLLANVDKWETILYELGYASDDPGWANFAEWYNADTVDLTPFVEKLYREIMLPYRPQ